MRSKIMTLIGTLSAATVLASCGTTAPAADATATTGSDKATSVSVTDYKGKTVTLAKPAERVVTLEWRETEEVISLGLQPVGLSDIEGYTIWDTAAKIEGNPIDVGTRTEPSLESIAKAKPDLIIGIERSIPEAALAQMNKIAPVLQLKGSDATRPIEHMKENYNRIATMTGKTATAKQVVAKMDETIAANAKLVKAGTPFALVSASANGSTIDFRMHSERSLPGAVAKQMGLKNVWLEPGDEAFGIGSLDLEGISKLPADTTLMVWVNGKENEGIDNVLPKNALWNSLPMVKENRVKKSALGVWLYGGPASVTQWSNELVKQLPK